MTDEEIDPILIAEVILDGDEDELSPQDARHAFPAKDYREPLRVQQALAIKRLYAEGGETVPEARWQQYLEHELEDMMNDREQGNPTEVIELYELAQRLYSIAGLKMEQQWRDVFAQAALDNLKQWLHSAEYPEINEEGQSAEVHLRDQWAFISALLTADQLEQVKHHFIGTMEMEAIRYSWLCYQLETIEMVIGITLPQEFWAHLGKRSLEEFTDGLGRKTLANIFARAGVILTDEMLRIALRDAMARGDEMQSESLSHMLDLRFTPDDALECLGNHHLRRGSLRRAFDYYRRARSKEGLLRLAAAARTHGRGNVAIDAEAEAARL